MSITGYGLSNLKGREVKINRGGPDSVTGTLVAVGQDYLAVRTKDGIVYVNSTHIKSLSETGRSGGAMKSVTAPVQAFNLLGVMQALRLRPIQINRGGPEKIEGVLVDTNQNYIVLTLKNNEIVRVPVYHIKSVKVVGNNNQSNSNQSNGNQSNQSKGNQSNNNQSKGNQSKGNQSKGNQSKGNQSKGNQSKGNQSKGNRR